MLDIRIKNKTDKICLLRDTAIPYDRNIIKKETENKLKYKNPSVKPSECEILNFFVITVIMGTTGNVIKGKNVETISRKH